MVDDRQKVSGILSPLAILVVGTVLLTALLTPVVVTCIVYFLGECPWPFSRVFDRVALGVVLLMLWALKGQFGLEGLWGKRKRPSKATIRLVMKGALLTLTMSMLLFPLILSGGELVIGDRTVSSFSWKMLIFFPAAFLIGCIEEPFFRWILLQKLQERLPFLFAAAASSALYAVVHFIAPVKSYEYAGYSMFAGIEYLGVVFERLISPAIIFPFTGLFLVGLVLCFVIRKTGSLALCIGLHAGWILAMKAVHYLTKRAPDYEFPLAVGRRMFLVSQPEVWISIIIVGALATRTRIFTTQSS